MDQAIDVRSISGVGDQLSIKLGRLGIKTVDDLIHYYPRRYDDFSEVTTIKSMRPGHVNLRVTVTSVTGKYLKKGLHISEALVSDNTGSVRLTWFNQPYRLTSLKKDIEYFISGKYELRYHRFAIYNPVIERVSDYPINTARIIPRYPLTKGVNSRDIRWVLSKVTKQIRQIPETLPPDISAKYRLMPLSSSLEAIHFPLSMKELQAAKRRLGFEELFMMILASELNKKAYLDDSALSINFDEDLARKFVSKLPFNLTNDQKIAVWQIYKDIAKTRPMNRLVEGDVGSGKTAVAAMAALMAINDGKQAVLMAPTELLARQHLETVNLMFKSIGLDSQVGMLIGGMSPSDKAITRRKIKNKEIMFVIGTHALIQEKVETPDLALVVIDEQHRFGVKQRQALKLKANLQPHMLSLSATPIPRSLALTLFGELDISRLNDKPINRLPIKTSLISESMLLRRLPALIDELNSGRQMFIVSSSIDTDPKYSTEEIFKWAVKHFPNHKIGLIHGRLKSEDKLNIMEDFVDNKLDILVATTVIEVGIDVPNATIMIVFDADKFGLAQLHQLRGRVGRGKYAGSVYLAVLDNGSPSDRLKALESSNDGFKLAELDLSIRGPGAIYGQLQHGELDLRIAGLDDTKLIKEAREAAKDFAGSGQSLLKYPKLHREVKTLQKLTNLN
jgi:ATP-dependent DNA helicase RecG